MASVATIKPPMAMSRHRRSRRSHTAVMPLYSLNNALRIRPDPNRGASANRARSGTATLPTHSPMTNGGQSRMARHQIQLRPNVRRASNARAIDAVTHSTSMSGLGTRDRNPKTGRVGGG
jgi:hypothetical protein